MSWILGWLGKLFIAAKNPSNFQSMDDDYLDLYDDDDFDNKDDDDDETDDNEIYEKMHSIWRGFYVLTFWE